MSLHRVRVFWVVVLLGLPGVLGVASATPAAAAPAAAAARIYTSLGDSYTAGALIPNQLTNPVGCLRSDHNYPHMAAAARGGLNLTDVSCSGATTVDMTSPQSVPFGTNPPQLDAVNAGTSVVSLGIGGNDIGFVSIVENCVAVTPWGPTKVGWNCKDFYDANGVDQIGAAIAATGPKVAAVLQAIHHKAPHAKVLVVGYPAILPPNGTGCWPQLPLTFNDVPYLRAKARQLNAVLASTASANGAIYVDTYGPSVGHDACTAESIRWVEPLVPDSPAAPVHPNAAGEAALAAIVLTKM